MRTPPKTPSHARNHDLTSQLTAHEFAVRCRDAAYFSPTHMTRAEEALALIIIRDRLHCIHALVLHAIGVSIETGSLIS